MIVWVNGAFGAGKTTLAAALAGQLADAVVADPEAIGSAVGTALRGHPWAAQDYQDCPPWAATTVSFISGLHAYTGGPVIVPMTVLVQDLATTMVMALSEAADVYHLVVHAERDVLKQRIAADRALGEDPARAAEVRAYRLRRLDDYQSAADQWLLHTAGHVIDTTALTRRQALTAALAHLHEVAPTVPVSAVVYGRQPQ
ncbi:AAA family ATPase [Streptomyces graminilatus]|uniref:AAA family ATPase n=1 Tax=Streptomyces graminilatus TaxID=1464070 RepID=UPI0006E3E8FE|nr:AAA family ATPase [Streptomyces graminilatus]